MLPDFPEVKRFVRRQFLREVRKQVPEHEPLLRGIRSSTAHEGMGGLLTRRGASSADLTFEAFTAELSITREQMRSFDQDRLMQQVASMSRQLAEHQARLLFERLAEAVEEVGNSVSAAELGAKEAFLETQRRMEVDFDPQTLEPKNQVLVLHPSQVESFKTMAEEWEKDPSFVEELARIRNKQIEDWRAREDSRQLVD